MVPSSLPRLHKPLCIVIITMSTLRSTQEQCCLLHKLPSIRLHTYILFILLIIDIEVFTELFYIANIK